MSYVPCVFLCVCAAVLPSSKPSPSKRRCSEENACLNGEENKEPVALLGGASEKTDKKPPMAPSNTCSAAERTAVQPIQPNSDHPPSSTEKMVAYNSHPVTVCANQVMKQSLMEKDNKILNNSTVSMQNPGNMKSRLQRLAEQRQYWDCDGRVYLFVCF